MVSSELRLSKYLDERGLPGTFGYKGVWDGGDTAAATSTLACLAQDPKEAHHWLDKLSWLNTGIPTRHPDTSAWWGKPDRFSVDQMIGVLCAGIRFGRTKSADNLIAQHKKHWFLYAWNTRGNDRLDRPLKFPDLSRPGLWALELRYCRVRWWARPLLWICDLGALASAIKWRMASPKDRITRNHMLTSLTCYEHMPTFISRLTFKLNNWNDLITRWRDHCHAVGEYPTADYFVVKLKNVS